MNLKPIIASIFFLCFHAFLHANQNDSILPLKDKYSALGWRMQYGKAIAHTSGVQPFANTYPLGFELDYHWLIVKNKQIDLYKCYPKLGATFGYWDFRNPDKFGYAITGMATLEAYYGLQNNFSFSYKCGFGFSYQSKPYDPVKNLDNEAFSTKVAFPLMLGFGGNYWMNDHMLINLNANLNHISNGGFKAPNLGLNWLSLSVGFDYYFNAPHLEPKEIVDWKEKHSPRNRIDINVYSGFKELKTTEFYAIPGVELKGSHQFARINAITLGAEYIYDQAMREGEPSDDEIDNFNKLSLAIGHEFLLGKFNFSQQFGVYVYNPHNGKSNMYQRFGLVYFISDHLNAGINLKTYFEKAQFVDARIGYSFHK